MISIHAAHESFRGCPKSNNHESGDTLVGSQRLFEVVVRASPPLRSPVDTRRPRMSKRTTCSPTANGGIQTRRIGKNGHVLMSIEDMEAVFTDIGRCRVVPPCVRGPLHRLLAFPSSIAGPQSTDLDMMRRGATIPGLQAAWKTKTGLDTNESARGSLFWHTNPKELNSFPSTRYVYHAGPHKCISRIYESLRGCAWGNYDNSGNTPVGSKRLQCQSFLVGSSAPLRISLNPRMR